MARKARPTPFARRHLALVIRDMEVSPTTDWPKHLRLARKILVEELSLDDAKALSVAKATFQAAHACAQARDKRSSDIAYFAQRQKVRGIFERIANCARRSPAKLRRTLIDGIDSVFHGRVVDGEDIEKLFDKSDKVLRFLHEWQMATSLKYYKARTGYGLMNLVRCERSNIRVEASSDNQRGQGKFRKLRSEVKVL